MSTLEDMKTELQRKEEDAKQSITVLDKKQKYLQKSLQDLTANLRDILQRPE